MKRVAFTLGKKRSNPIPCFSCPFPGRRLQRTSHFNPKNRGKPPPKWTCHLSRHLSAPPRPRKMGPNKSVPTKGPWNKEGRARGRGPFLLKWAMVSFPNPWGEDHFPAPKRTYAPVLRLVKESCIYLANEAFSSLQDNFQTKRNPPIPSNCIYLRKSQALHLLWEIAVS